MNMFLAQTSSWKQTTNSWSPDCQRDCKNANLHPKIQIAVLNVIHVVEKNQTTADALSRVSYGVRNQADVSLLENATLLAIQVTKSLPISKNKLQRIKQQQKSDPETARICEYYLNGWPTYYNGINIPQMLLDR